MRAPIDDAVALITGASSGIGAAIARELAPRAKTLVLVARRKQRLVTLATDLREAFPNLTVDVRSCDLTDRDALSDMCDAVEEEHGCVDILVNNAGLGDIGVFDWAPWDKTERMLELNVRALTYLTHRLLKPMVAQKRGGILMISSGFGLSFAPGFAGYVATKHYVTGFCESLRLELRHLGVVVTQVCPGPVATEFEEIAGNFTGVSPGLIQISAERCARVAVRGFSRGRAMVIPGAIVTVLMWMAAITPRWLLRLVYAPIGKLFRERQAKAKQLES